VTYIYMDRCVDIHIYEHVYIYVYISLRLLVCVFVEMIVVVERLSLSALTCAAYTYYMLTYIYSYMYMYINIKQLAAVCLLVHGLEFVVLVVCLLALRLCIQGKLESHDDRDENDLRLLLE